MHNPKYPLELIQRIITVSLETMKIVRELPELDIWVDMLAIDCTFCIVHALPEQADCKIQSSTIILRFEPFMLKMQHLIKNKMFLSNAAYCFYAYPHVLGTFLGTFVKI